MIGKSIRIFLADATVTGVRYAELVNWTGQAVACPRSRLNELKDWPEASKPGVYLLFEARLGDAKPAAYIGESESVAERLGSHDRDKEYWNEVVIFTSKDENLTKAHVKFLECALVGIARAADRYQLMNGNSPADASLPRADRDAMAEFIGNIRMVLGTLGYPILEPLVTRRVTPVEKAGVDAVPQFNPLSDLTFRVNHLVGLGMVTDEGFVVRKGSTLAKTHMDSAAMRVTKLRDQLLADGRVSVLDDRLVLNEDVLLSSPSYAAVLVAGTMRSGPQSWIATDGRTMKSIEEEELLKRKPLNADSPA